MEAKFVLTSCALLALIATSSAGTTQLKSKPIVNDLEKALANVEATFSEVYHSIVVAGEIILLLPIKATKLIGMEALNLVHDVEMAFGNIGKFVKNLSSNIENLVVQDLLIDGTRNILMIVRTIRKTLEIIKKRLEHL
uniref:Apolipophorin-3 n=1 Tax=Lygus hesperus TaxID=30085 RepID=A0A0A9WFC4_LYGHE